MKKLFISFVALLGVVASLDAQVVKVFKAGELLYSSTEADSVVFEPGETVIAGHEYVDMGLPSGILWARLDVGSSSEAEAGSLYAWGETETKEVYDWTTYKFCEGTSSSLTKYNYSSSYGVVDNLSELEPEDDVVAVKWGSNWCMPTDAETQELCDNTTISFEMGDVSYFVLTSKVNGAQLRFIAKPSDLGFVADFWTRTAKKQKAKTLNFEYRVTENALYSPCVYSRVRCNGYPVRGIYKAPAE